MSKESSGNTSPDEDQIPCELLVDLDVSRSRLVFKVKTLKTRVDLDSGVIEPAKHFLARIYPLSVAWTSPRGDRPQGIAASSSSARAFTKSLFCRYTPKVLRVSLLLPELPHGPLHLTCEEYWTPWLERRLYRWALLTREIQRIDEYFSNYERELRGRRIRGGADPTTARKNLEERIAAAKAEHRRRRLDQVDRHAIRITPHVDALLLVAEPAWATRVAIQDGREQQTRSALYVPHTRQWHLHPAEA